MFGYNNISPTQRCIIIARLLFVCCPLVGILYRMRRGWGLFFEYGHGFVVNGCIQQLLITSETFSYQHIFQSNKGVLATNSANKNKTKQIMTNLKEAFL